MRFSFKALLGGLFLLFAISGAANAQVVISQVYGGGGNTGATYRSDFVELHNNGATSVDLSTWSIQYSSSTGTTWTRSNLNGSIAAGAYFLVKQADGAGTTLPALPTPDNIGTIAMSGTAGKVALVNNQTTLTGSCPLGGTVTDFVGYGTATNCSETAPTATLGNALAAVRAGNGCIDVGNNSTDFTALTPIARNTASPILSCGVPSLTVSINDTTVIEGNSGAVTATFTISLSAPAPVGGVSFDIATADNTATTSDTDYLSKALTSQIIAAGSSSYTFDVTVNGDVSVEPNETFFVNVSNVVGATVADGQGQGTITNDDIVLTHIHAIQGSGDASLLVGSTVSTRGVVTGLRNTGFFMQSTDADADADPSTSQGIFVFTSSAPTVARGDLLIVTGNVVEFFQLTEIGTPVISVLSNGNSLPTAITLTAADGALPSPERYEGMRVIPNLTIVAPAGGNINEANATSTSDGNFYGVLPGVARPFREPGVSVLDTFVPAVGVPVFDGNLELIVVQSRGLGGLSMNPNAGDTLSGISGILDFGFGFYKFYPDSGQTFTSTVAPTAVSNRAPEEFTVAGFNLQRFFDTVNDPAISEPVLSATALNNRLAKTADAICGYLKTPDILGVVEVENIGVLTQLADTINAGRVPTGSAVPSCNSAPRYVPYLVEGNDVGGIDVGFLVSNKLIGSGNVRRVIVQEVVQENKDETVLNPDSTTSLLNDRPTLRLQALVRTPKGTSYPITVMINHLRSLSSVNDPVDGPRVRNKRLKQAESLARLVNARQLANPNEKIVLLGDFNAFEFNDGFTDSMGIITGKEAPAAEVTLHSGFVVATPLTNMTTVDVPGQRYSFSFDGSAQSLDHAVVNDALFMQDGIRVEHARINADFAQINYGIYGAAPTRVSDHDPVVLFIKPRAFEDVNLGVSVSNPDTSLNSGSNTTFTVNGNNLNTTSDADNVVLTLKLDAAIPGVTVITAGWACAAPVIVATSTSINCTTSNFTPLGTASFTVQVPVPSSFAGGNLTLSASISADQGDNNTANNIASDFVSVIGPKSNLAIHASGPASSNINYKSKIIISADNHGPDAAQNATIAITTNAASSAFQMAAPAGWACSLDATYSNARFLCAMSNGTAMANDAHAEFTLTFAAPSSMSLYNLIVGVGISAATADPYASNNENSYSLFINEVREIGLPSNPDN
jgi:uncharacterized protein